MVLEVALKSRGTPLTSNAPRCRVHADVTPVVPLNTVTILEARSKVARSYSSDKGITSSKKLLGAPPWLLAWRPSLLGTRFRRGGNGPKVAQSRGVHLRDGTEAELECA